MSGAKYVHEPSDLTTGRSTSSPWSVDLKSVCSLASQSSGFLPLGGSKTP